MASYRLWLIASAMMLAPPALAQDNSAQGNDAGATVGAPVLREFELEGTRTTPAIVVPPPVATPSPTPAPAPVRVAPAPPASRTDTPAPRPAPRVVEAAPAAPDIQPTTEAAPTTTAPLPAPVPQPQVEPPAVSDTVEPAAPFDIWPWALGALGLLVLLGGAFLFVRRARYAEPEEPEQAVVRAPVATPARVVPPAPTPTPLEPAPAISLEFKPERVVATDKEATVHFELIVRNTGDGEARDVYINARLFSASHHQKQEIDAFLGGGVAAEGQALQLPPGHGAQFRSRVLMPRDQVHALMVGGRPLFVPTVAVTLVYRYGANGQGQVANTYLVGIEPEAPSAKMGPFRLDVGPRVYRRVGSRPLEFGKAA